MSQVFNMHALSNVRQRELHTTETIVPECVSAFEGVRVIEKQKVTNHKVLIKSQHN